LRPKRGRGEGLLHWIARGEKKVRAFAEMKPTESTKRQCEAQERSLSEAVKGNLMHLEDLEPGGLAPSTPVSRATSGPSKERRRRQSQPDCLVSDVRNSMDLSAVSRSTPGLASVHHQTDVAATASATGGARRGSFLPEFTPIAITLAKSTSDVTEANEMKSPLEADRRSMDSFTTAASSLSLSTFCKICHCGSEAGMPLIAPCFCSGSLKYVHQECLQKWIKSADIKRCELCKYPFDMQSKVSLPRGFHCQSYAAVVLVHLLLSKKKCFSSPGKRQTTHNGA